MLVRAELIRENSNSSEDPQGEFDFPIRDLVRVVWQRLWVVLLAVVVCVGVAVGVSFGQDPVYQASIKILVGQEQGLVQDPAQIPNLQELTVTMSEAVATRSVAQGVVERLNLEESPEDLVDDMSVEVIPDTQFIEVSYTDTDPERAQRIVNAIGQEFSRRISEVSPQVSAITATVWERAVVPEVPVRPNPVLYSLIAAVLGSMVGVGLALLLEQLNDRWRSPEEAEQISGIPVLGVMPEFKAPKQEKRQRMVSTRRRHTREEEDDPRGCLVTISDPTGAAAESHRSLRTNLSYAAHSAQAIVITSPGPADGKSTICANLGVALAQADKSTLIVDCDFRNPAMHKIFGVHNVHGLEDVLREERSLQEVWQEPLPGLKVLPVGAIPPDPAKLIDSKRFADFIDSSRRDFDYILIDAAPMELVSDPVVIATHVDGVLLVIDVQRTDKKSVRQAVHSMQAVGVNVLGTVMNRGKIMGRGYYRYGYTHIGLPQDR